eukprot:gene174-299_t
MAEEINLLAVKEVFPPDVKNMEQLNTDDDVHNLQFCPSTLLFENSFVESYACFEDYKAFESQFSNDIGKIRQMNEVLTQGQNFLETLYTFRSVSRAIPMTTIIIPVNATDDEKELLTNKKHLYNKTIVDILRPEILKIRNLMEYVLSTISFLLEHIKYCIQMNSNDKIIPEILYIKIIHILDTLIRIDNIKDQKACLNNDFSRYKRALGALATQPGMALTSAMLEEQMQLQHFLSNQDPKKAKNYICYNIREEIKRINGYEEFLFFLLEYSLEFYEKNQYILPEEKFRILRILPHILLLLDGNIEDNKSLNIFRSKKSLVPYQKLMKQYPIVPLYGDMPMNMIYILERFPHFEKNTMTSSWVEPIEKKIPDAYNLNIHWLHIKNSFSDIIILFTNIKLNLDENPFSKEINNSNNIERCKDIYQFVKDCIHKLSEWKALILLVLSWKYTHPHTGSKNNLNSPTTTSTPTSTKNTDVTPPSTPKAENLGVEYERVLKFNFNESELSMFVDIISMIKSLGDMLIKEVSRLEPIIRFHAYMDTNQLIQHDIVPILNRAHKKNKKVLIDELLKLRVISLNTENLIQTSNSTLDYVNYSKKTNKAEKFENIQPRVVYLSYVQLQLIRTHVFSLYNDTTLTSRRISLFSKVDLDREDINILQNFYEKSYFYSYLFNYAHYVRNDIIDMSDLWYREFFLELTRCIQFPVEMSLPWILIEHIIKRKDKEIPMIEDIIHILDIYNDTANHALNILQQQSLYDEIEAETDLILDQFIYLISDLIYSHFKEFSASTSLDITFKLKLESLKNKPYLSIKKHLLESLLTQRNILLLGRKIDLNFLLCQNITNNISRDIDSALKIFESADISSLPELKIYINLIKQSHGYISKYLDLDPFDNIFHEVNESFATTAFCGRLAIHVLRSLITDIFPNYSYNIHTQRFVPSPVAMRPKHAQQTYTGKNPVKTRPKVSKPFLGTSTKIAVFGLQLSKSYEYSGRLTRGFFGKLHIESYLSLCGYEDLPLIIEQCVEYLVIKVREVHAYYEALSEGIPPCKLPKFMYKSGGAYGHFEVLLKPIIEYEGLKSEVFQCFREVGNVLMFLKDLSDTIEIWNSFQFIHSNIILNPISKSNNNNRNDPPTATNNTTNNDDNEYTYNSRGRGSANVNIESESESALEMLMNKIIEQKSPDALSSTSTSTSIFVNTTKNVIETTKNQLFLHGRKSLLVYALAHLQQTIQDMDTSLSSNTEIYDVIEVEDPKEFHRFLSALNFIFCMPSSIMNFNVEYTGPEGTSDVYEFGHGFLACGCAILHLLGQRIRYELLDFSNHVINVHRHENIVTMKSSQVGSIDSNWQQAANHFIKNASEQNTLYLELMDLFESSFHVEESFAQEGIFHPPASDTISYATSITSSMSQHHNETGGGGSSSNSTGAQVLSMFSSEVSLPRSFYTNTSSKLSSMSSSSLSSSILTGTETTGTKDDDQSHSDKVNVNPVNPKANRPTRPPPPPPIKPPIPVLTGGSGGREGNDIDNDMDADATLKTSHSQSPHYSTTSGTGSGTGSTVVAPPVKPPLPGTRQPPPPPPSISSRSNIQSQSQSQSQSPSGSGSSADVGLAVGSEGKGGGEGLSHAVPYDPSKRCPPTPPALPLPLPTSTSPFPFPFPSTPILRLDGNDDDDGSNGSGSSGGGGGIQSSSVMSSFSSPQRKHPQQQQKHEDDEDDDEDEWGSAVVTNPSSMTTSMRPTPPPPLTSPPPPPLTSSRPPPPVPTHKQTITASTVTDTVTVADNKASESPPVTMGMNTPPPRTPPPPPCSRPVSTSKVNMSVVQENVGNTPVVATAGAGAVTSTSPPLVRPPPPRPPPPRGGPPRG